MVAIVGKAIPPQRKRVIDAMHLREPDRVPIGLWGTYEGYRNLRKGLGMEYNDELFNYRTGSTTWTTDVAFELDIAEKLGLDFVRISLGPPGGSPGFRTIAFEEVPFDMGIPPPAIPINVDEWGVVRKWTPHEKGGYYEMIGYPLFHATSMPLEEGLKELEAFPWPDPRDLLMMTDSPIPGMSLRDYCKYVHQETPFALMAQAGKGGLFEQAKYLVGYAKIFSDFIEAPKFLDALLTKLVELEIEFNRTMIDEIGEYIDWIRVSPEDLASEKTSFVSLKMFQNQLIPHYHRAHIATKEMFLKKNPLGKIQFHSCGAVPLSFLKAMIGGKTKDGHQAVDGFDSMPPKVARHSGPRSKKLMLGDKMFFYGGIDVQETLPFGTPEQVRREVRLRIWELAKGGGYIVSSSHRLEHDVPVANTLAMIEETKEYGKYPLPEQPPDGADVGEDLPTMQR